MSRPFIAFAQGCISILLRLWNDDASVLGGAKIWQAAGGIYCARNWLIHGPWSGIMIPMIAWYDKPASRAQIRYLKNLGYIEPQPESMAEASAAIDEMLDSGDTERAWREILAERPERATLFEGTGDSSPKRRRGTPIVALPFIIIGSVFAAFFWLLSHLIGAVGWILHRLASLLLR